MPQSNYDQQYNQLCDSVSKPQAYLLKAQTRKIFTKKKASLQNSIYYS